MKNAKPLSVGMRIGDYAKTELHHPDNDRTVILICRVDGNYIATATDNIIDPPSKAIWIESPSQ